MYMHMSARLTVNTYVYEVEALDLEYSHSGRTVLHCPEGERPPGLARPPSRRLWVVRGWAAEAAPNHARMACVQPPVS